jgi:hypothetical protein
MPIAWTRRYSPLGLKTQAVVGAWSARHIHNPESAWDTCRQLLIPSRSTKKSCPNYLLEILADNYWYRERERERERERREACWGEGGGGVGAHCKREGEGQWVRVDGERGRGQRPFIREEGRPHLLRLFGGIPCRAQCCFAAGHVAAPGGIGSAQDKIDPSLRRVPQ